MSTHKDFSEKFTARMWAIVNLEASDCSFDEAIVVMMPRKADADTELGRRQKLLMTDDDYLDEHHAVLPVHVDGVGWNSSEPCPEDWPK